MHRAKTLRQQTPYGSKPCSLWSEWSQELVSQMGEEWGGVEVCCLELPRSPAVLGRRLMHVLLLTARRERLVPFLWTQSRREEAPGAEPVQTGLEWETASATLVQLFATTVGLPWPNQGAVRCCEDTPALCAAPHCAACPGPPLCHSALHEKLMLFPRSASSSRLDFLNLEC